MHVRSKSTAHGDAAFPVILRPTPKRDEEESWRPSWLSRSTAMMIVWAVLYMSRGPRFEHRRGDRGPGACFSVIITVIVICTIFSVRSAASPRLG